MSKHKMPQIPYVQAHQQFGRQRPRQIVLRGTFTTSSRGAALGIAQSWHNSQEPWTSGHYTVDEETCFRCVDDNVIAGTKEHNHKGAIRVAICAEPVNNERFWDEHLHARVLARAAKLVADLSLAHKIPMKYSAQDQTGRWAKRGIIVDTSNGWPYGEFAAEVNAQRALKSHI